MTGKLKVKGNMMLATKLDGLLGVRYTLIACFGPILLIRNRAQNQKEGKLSYNISPPMRIIM